MYDEQTTSSSYRLHLAECRRRTENVSHGGGSVGVPPDTVRAGGPTERTQSVAVDVVIPDVSESIFAPGAPNANNSENVCSTSPEIRSLLMAATSLICLTYPPMVVSITKFVREKNILRVTRSNVFIDDYVVIDRSWALLLCLLFVLLIIHETWLTAWYSPKNQSKRGNTQVRKIKHSESPVRLDFIYIQGVQVWNADFFLKKTR